MRVTLKLVAAIIAAIVVVMAVRSYQRVQRETAQFEADQVHDHLRVGHTLRAAGEAVRPTEGAAHIDALIARLATDEPEITVRRMSLAAGSSGERPAVQARQLDALRRGHEFSVVEDERRFTYVPLNLATAPRAALEVSESLARERRAVRASVLHSVDVGATVVVACGAIVALLGYAFIGRPMRALTAQARRIGAGDLAAPPARVGRDEIGEFAREMNAMCQQLAAARRAVAAESEARIAALAQLRHADRLRTVGQLASGLAHELGTPLNVVRARARLAETHAASDAPTRANARIIVEQVDAMSALIRQLLDYARRRGPAVRSVDLRESVTRTATLLTPLAARSGIAIEVDPRGEPVEAEVDPVLIEQVVTNLVVNSLHAAGRGGHVRLSAGTAATAVHEETAAQSNCPFIRVRDDGAGMAPEVIDRLFEPFFTTKDVGEGTGLGLFVAHGIVRDHGGWIAVESERGGDTQVTVFLPRRTPPADATATSRGLQMASLGRHDAAQRRGEPRPEPR